MKVYPKDLSTVVKLAHQAVLRLFTLYVPEKKLSDCIIEAYGWKSFDDFQKNKYKETVLVHELHLSYMSYSKLIDKVVGNIFSCAMTHQASIDNVENILTIKTDELPKELVIKIQRMADSLKSRLPRTDLGQYFYQNLDTILQRYRSDFSFEFKKDEMKGLSLFFNKSETTRINNIIRLFSLDILNEAKGLWIINESEHVALKNSLADFDQHNLYFMKDHDLEKTFEHFHSTEDGANGQHWFFIYPDRYPAPLSGNYICEPNKLLSEIITNLTSTYHSQINTNDHIIAEKKLPFTFIYVNSTISKITHELTILSAQSRTLNIAIALSLPNLYDVMDSQETLPILNANANFKAFDATGIDAISRFANTLNQHNYFRYLTKTEPTKRNSLFSFPRGSNYILINSDGNVERLF